MRAETLLCEEDSGETVVLGHKLSQFPIAVATWDKRVEAAVAATATSVRTAEVSAKVGWQTDTVILVHQKWRFPDG